MRQILSFLLILLPVLSWSQPNNDNCQNAFKIRDVTNWCSDVEAFTTVNGTASGYSSASCWGPQNPDVWFEFTAFATDVVIKVTGEFVGSGRGGSMGAPEIALYHGACGGSISELECGSDIGGINIVQMNQGGLLVGEAYLIRVQSRTAANGSFQICLNNFNPPVDPGQDCPVGAVLCDKSPFAVQTLSGGGADPDEAFNTCLGGLGLNSEQQSTWFKWVARDSGSLTFVLTPLNPSDDLDFVLYELPGGIDDCASKVAIRCMATACEGPTGLDSTSTDLEENLNCDPGEDGFLQQVIQSPGVAYALMINNFSVTGFGFQIEFGGTGTFQGPVAEFAIDPTSGLKCEQDFQVVDSSFFEFGSITNYEWTFGVNAEPLTAMSKGPHNVKYNSIGTKYIVLKLQTDLGCVVTDIREIDVQPCCEDVPAPPLVLLGSSMDPLCVGENSGAITLEGTGGTPEYQFSLAGGEFSENLLFDNLTSGTYFAKVIDAYGCADSIQINLFDPPPLSVDAGLDQTIDLGGTTTLFASHQPGTVDVGVSWSSSKQDDSVRCIDFNCFNVEVLPPGTTTYTITVTSGNNCSASDDVVVSTIANRNIFYPNVISPKGSDPRNRQFTLYGTASAQEIDVLRVYDRWGGVVFERNNFLLGDPLLGWGGLANGKEQISNVFTFYAVVRFFDREEIVYKGDITLLR